MSEIFKFVVDGEEIYIVAKDLESAKIKLKDVLKEVNEVKEGD